MAEAIRAFLDYERHARRVTPGTLKLYAFYLRKLLPFAARDARRGRPLGPRTVDRYLAHFGRRGYGSGMTDAYKIARHFLEWAFERGLIESNVARDLRAPIKRDPRRVYLTRPEVLHLLASMGSAPRPHARRDRAVLAACYFAGLRISEALALKPEDVRLEEGVLLIYGKGGKAREVPFNGRLTAILREWVRERDRASPWLFPARAHNRVTGGRLDGDNFRKALRTFYLPRAGLGGRRVSPHALRRSAARIMRDHKVPLEEIQDFLGHRHITTTMAYVGESPHRLRASVRHL